MLKDLTQIAASRIGTEEDTARMALGIIFNAAERQGAPFADKLFAKLPGARALSARCGSEIGAATGTIARLIEQTPGGKRYVASKMIRDLHAIGLSHKEIGELMPSIAGYAEETLGLSGFGHLGDLLGTDMDAAQAEKAAAA